MSKMIQLRNVPDDLHKVLKSRAALEGKSLSDYLIGGDSASCRVSGQGRVTPPAPGSNPGTPGCAAGANDPGRTWQAVIVVNASAVLELFLGTTAERQAHELLWFLAFSFVRLLISNFRSTAACVRKSPALAG
ncbi:MAG: hypothetical protein OXG96_08585 [Acidobacteria bacterium]|nr:hypothetical protein [Acidobacteriota bacterium]